MNSLLRTACIMALLAGGVGIAHAEDVQAVAAAVPGEVTDIASGGNWSQGEMNGVFRAITITRQNGETTLASVVVQLMVLDKTGPAKVVKTIVVKEVAERKLTNAFLTMDVENDNELTLNITSYDAEKDQDVSLLAKFDSTGKYEIVTATKEDPAQAPGAVKKDK